MLVLSRKKKESIVINGNIRIEVLQIKGKQIRLGITAPSSMKVLRGELPVCNSTSESNEAIREEVTVEATVPFPPKKTASSSRRVPHAVTERSGEGSLHDLVSAVVASN